MHFWLQPAPLSPLIFLEGNTSNHWHLKKIPGVLWALKAKIIRGSWNRNSNAATPFLICWKTPTLTLSTYFWISTLLLKRLVTGNFIVTRVSVDLLPDSHLNCRWLQLVKSKSKLHVLHFLLKLSIIATCFLCCRLLPHRCIHTHNDNYELLDMWFSTSNVKSSDIINIIYWDSAVIIMDSDDDVVIIEETTTQAKTQTGK